MATFRNFDSQQEADDFLNEAKRIRQYALDHGIKRLSTPELYHLAVYHQGITITENGKTMQGGDPHGESYRLIYAEIAERMIHEPADRNRPTEENQGKLFDAVKDGVTDMLKAKCQENLENCRKLQAYFAYSPKQETMPQSKVCSIRANKREADILESRLSWALSDGSDLDNKEHDPIKFYAKHLSFFNNDLQNYSPNLVQNSNPMVLSILDKLVATISNLFGLTTYAAAQSARSKLINENRYEPLLTVTVTYNQNQFKEKLAEIGNNHESLENLRNDLLQDLGKLVEKCDPTDEKTLTTMRQLAERIVKKIDKVDKILESEACEPLVGGKTISTLSRNQKDLIKLGEIGLNFMEDNNLEKFRADRGKILFPTAPMTPRL